MTSVCVWIFCSNAGRRQLNEKEIIPLCSSLVGRLAVLGPATRLGPDHTRLREVGGDTFNGIGTACRGKGRRRRLHGSRRYLRAEGSGSFASVASAGSYVVPSHL
ncbi:hypothetical protein NL676_027235 [Syzygium grande]|nr:hypothetical protein NL676_027235 [Syzygium grande]